MKKMLKAFVAWLDRKFPDKIPFTPEDSAKIKACVESITVMEVKIKDMDKEINKFNVSLGFGAVGNKLALTPFQR